jgi:hypothetical protein
LIGRRDHGGVATVTFVLPLMVKVQLHVGVPASVGRVQVAQVGEGATPVHVIWPVVAAVVAVSVTTELPA